MLARLGLKLPIFQAPMAGCSTPAMAAAVSSAGALGAIAVGASSVSAARKDIQSLKAQTAGKKYNVNVFVHAPPRIDPKREREWLSFLAPLFAKFGAAPPANLAPAYPSFEDSNEMLDLLVEERVPVVSFHFGLPSAEAVRALKGAGSVLLASATSLNEALAAQRAGMDGVIAQGIEAGGHRGIFDPLGGPDEGLGTMALVRLLVAKVDLPIIAAGGIMDGQGVAAALKLGAVAAQLGTAFVACPESAASDEYRALLLATRESSADQVTTMTSLISGRPARSLVSAFTRLEKELGAPPPPDYPIAYTAGKALHAAAKAEGEHGFGALWAGQGAPLARRMGAAELINVLAEELRVAQAQ